MEDFEFSITVIEFLDFTKRKLHGRMTWNSSTQRFPRLYSYIIPRLDRRIHNLAVDELHKG